LQLTLDVSGRFNVAHLRAPALSTIPGMGERFRVHDDSVRRSAIPDGRRFTYTVRPLVAGTQEFPAIPVSFFDTVSRTYATVYTDPIPLRVEAVAQFDPASIISGEASMGSTEATLRIHSDSTIPAGITVTLGSPYPLRPTFGFWLALTVLPLGIAIVSLLIGVSVRFPVVRRKVRYYRAYSSAVAALRQATTAAEAWRAVQGYFQDRYAVSAESLSPDDIRRLVPADAAESLLAVLQPLFDRQYHRDAAGITATDRAAIERALLSVQIFKSQMKHR